MDETGIHYPNHAQVSADYWKDCGGSQDVENLIRHDMFFHTCSAKDLEDTVLTKQELSTLLLSSLAEIHANAELFGGIESTNFKIKFKQIDKRGKKFCKENLHDSTEEYVYVFIRNDLPDAQKAVQSGHSVIEACKKFNIDVHPSLVYVKVKNEKKLKSVIQELIDKNIDFVFFRDTIFNREITTVATEPLQGKQREVLSRYTLL